MNLVTTTEVWVEIQKILKCSCCPDMHIHQSPVSCKAQSLKLSQNDFGARYVNADLH